MFEQTLLASGGRTQGAWTVLVSFIGQTLGVGIVTLVPLVATDTLPAAHWVPRIFTAPSPPPPPPPVPAGVKAPRTRANASAVVGGRLVEPAAVPRKPAEILVDPAPLIQASEEASDSRGVPGGVPGGVPYGIPGSVPSQALAPPPQPVAPKTPAPPLVTRLKVGGKVQAAKLVHRPALVYPPLAKQARISGVVQLVGIIARDGTIQQLRVISGHPLLIPAALDGVRKWVYRPTLLNGEPVEVIAPIDVIFTLN